MEKRYSELEHRLEGATMDTEWVDRIKQAKTPEELVGLYKEKGIELSREDQERFLDMLKTVDNTELTDDELSEVSGGLQGLPPDQTSTFAKISEIFKRIKQQQQQQQQKIR